jgi:hypothetical protein
MIEPIIISQVGSVRGVVEVGNVGVKRACIVDK